MASDVKMRVISRVTGIPFIPKKTIEIAENQVVIDRRKALEELSAYDEEIGIYDKVVVEKPIRYQPIVGQTIIAVDGKAISLGAEDVTCEFASGGIVENTESLIIGATATDHVLPRAVVEKFEALSDAENKLQSAQSETEIKDGDFLLNFSDSLNSELDSFLDPDTRTLHFPDPASSREEIDKQFDGIDEFYSGHVNSVLPPVGAPDSSEVCEHDEHLAEHNARVQAALDAGEPGMTKRPTDDVVLQSVQAPEPTDYEMSAELGLNVHAYRWLKAQIKLLESRIELAKTNAVMDVLNAVTSVVQRGKF